MSDTEVGQQNNAVGQNKIYRTLFRVFFFSYLTILGIFYLWILINSPRHQDSIHSLIYEIPIPLRSYSFGGNSFYVDKPTAFTFWGGVVGALVLTVFGIVKGFIKDIFLDKRRV
jgi:hypothetical protein